MPPMCSRRQLLTGLLLCVGLVAATPRTKPNAGAPLDVADADWVPPESDFPLGDAEWQDEGGVFEEMSNKFGVIFSFEHYETDRKKKYVAPHWQFPTVEIDLKSMDLSQALDAVSRATGAKFIWERHGRMVNIIDSRCTSVPNYPFAERRRRVKFQGRWKSLASFFHRVLKPSSYPRYSYYRMGREEVMTEGWPIALELRDVTVRECFNIACDLAQCEWSSTYCAWDETYHLEVHRAGLTYVERPAVMVVDGGPAGDARETSAPAERLSHHTSVIALLAAAVGILAGLALAHVLGRSIGQQRSNEKRN